MRWATKKTKIQEMRRVAPVWGLETRLKFKFFLKYDLYLVQDASRNA